MKRFRRALLLFFSVLVIFQLCHYCSTYRVNRTVLFQGAEVYPWKVEYIRENNFPAGKRHFYQVFYGSRQLVIPKEVLHSIADIKEFVAVGSFEIQDNNNQSVLISVENITKKEDGFNQHQFMSFLVAKINTSAEEMSFGLYDLDRQLIAVFQL